MNKNLIGLAAAVALIGTPALAADIPLKAPPLPPPAIFSWTGFYGGANVGYSWGNSSNSWNIFAANAGGDTVCPPAGGALCVAGTDSNHMNGVIGGLQIGYNWQTGRYVFGIETDFDATGQKGNQTFNGANGASGPVPTAPAAAAYTEKLSWLGTFRGRVGIVSDRTLFYATGGLAYGEVKSAGSAIISGGTVPFGAICSAPLGTPGATCPLGNWSNSTDRAGWTLGAGIEQAFAGNWSVKFEYLYVDLGRVNTNFATLAGCFGGISGGGAACFGIGPGTGTISSRITDNIVRLGINYKFSGPMVAQ